MRRPDERDDTDPDPPEDGDPSRFQGENDASQEAVELPIDGVLDLHAFAPADVADLVADYLKECRSRGILRIRIIHGKGIGTLRRVVHAALSRDPAVLDYALAGQDEGGWGATIVTLAPPA